MKTCFISIEHAGDRAGKEIVQLYVRPADNAFPRPIRELKGFAKVTLEPGQTTTVTFTLDKRSFAYWEEQIHDWHFSIECPPVCVFPKAKKRRPCMTAASKSWSTGMKNFIANGRLPERDGICFDWMTNYTINIHICQVPLGNKLIFMRTLHKYRFVEMLRNGKRASDLLMETMGIFQYVDLHVWTNSNA